MSVLPEHPDLDQARRRAKELLRAARAGDARALSRLAAVSAPLTLAGAQLAMARELGQPSWVALVREIEARNASIPENAAAGADPDAPGPDGRSARRRALTAGVAATVELLGGGSDDPVDRLLEAIVTGDGDAARGLATADSGLVDRLEPADAAALVAAAERGNVASVGLMLELGFPVDARREGIDDDGATALHAAAWAGGAETVALLLDHGADLSARDTRWHSEPLGWALVGSGEAPAFAPAPDWVATVGQLLDAGASLDGISFNSDEPSAGVLELLRSRGLAGDAATR